ncbi:MAG: serine/threonine protein kinase [Acidobacteria bacterium]|nr:serine/threonine protein kinase [Acidobacteriota bacterium]MBI3487690.1 serine/threonine protein kinase [Acidobacteriota bacterium]
MPPDLEFSLSALAARDLQSESVTDPALSDLPCRLAWKGYSAFQLIAKGGTGTIYKAKDLQLKRWVALKFLNQGRAPSISRLLREARAQAKVDHPHVLKVYEVGEHDGQPFIAMQLVEGGTLRQMLLLFTLEQRVRLVMRVAAGLQAAHRMGLLHLDIKPDNILVETTEQDEPWPYLTDFGLVRPEAPNLRRRAFGTPNYASPEQKAGGGALLDRRSDIYSLGATLYFALSGRSPLDGLAPQGCPVDEPIPLGQRDSLMPRDLQAITERCMKRDPRDRYPSAKAMADDLRRYLDGAPVEARKRTLRYRLEKWVGRNRRLAVAAIATGLLLAGLGGWSLAALHRRTVQARLAERFGREVQEMEHLLRLAHLARRHDRRPAVALLRRTMKAIEEEMRILGGSAAGPGAFALGRGHASLEEWEEARLQLDRAWSLGFRTPACARARGETLAALFHEAVMSICVMDAQARRQALAGLQTRYRDPALECFSLAEKGGLHTPYLGAMAAYLKGDEARAMALAEEAGRQSPWLYEADGLRCDILRSQGRALFMAGRDREAGVLFDAQALILGRLLDVAPSDPKNWLRKGWVDLFQFYARRGTDDSWLGRAKADFETCIEMDPDLPDGYRELSDIYGVLAREQRGRDPLPLLDRSLEFARLGHTRQRGGRAVLGLGLALVRRGEARLDRKLDPGDDFDQAILALQQVVKEGLPGGEAHYHLANAYAGRARQAYASGEGPLPWARQAVQWSRLGQAFEPGNLSREILSLSRKLDCAEWEALCHSPFSTPPEELAAEVGTLLRGVQPDNPLKLELRRHQNRAQALEAWDSGQNRRERPASRERKVRPGRIRTKAPAEARTIDALMGTG